MNDRPRYLYRFGDVKYKEPDPAVSLFASQRYDFMSEIVSAAIMSGKLKCFENSDYVKLSLFCN